MNAQTFFTVIELKVVGRAGTSHLPFHGEPTIALLAALLAKLDYLFQNFGTNVTAHVHGKQFQFSADKWDSAGVTAAELALHVAAVIKENCEQPAPAEVEGA